MTLRTKFILLFLMAVFLAGQAPAGDWYVATNGSGDGSSWAKATNSISGAITAASDEDNVLVSNGIYLTRFTVGKGVAVRGFSSNPADTIIDAGGSSAGAVVNLNHAAALVSGFTITNGRANGVYIDNAGGTLSNCIVSGNIRGVYIRTGLVIDSAICGNVVTNTQSAGAGIYMLDGEVRDCVISNNVSSNYPAATMYGGGILINKGTITRCAVVNNSCINVPGKYGYGGGIMCNAGTPLIVVSQCVIRANTAGDAGGGIILNASNTLYGCTVENNLVCTNNASGQGGGVWIAGQNSVVQNCVIRGNTSWKNGGGVFITSTVKCSAFLRNCLIYNNYAVNRGGGIYLSMTLGDVAYIASCTIVSNVASADYGGGLFCGQSTNYIYNTVIASNQAPTGGADVYAAAGGTTNFFFNCCVPTLVLPPSKGNITTEPLFNAFNGANFHMVKGSPCINTGTNQDWMTNALDLDSRTRIRYGTVDIGAYEYMHDATIYRAW